MGLGSGGWCGVLFRAQTQRAGTEPKAPFGGKTYKLNKKEGKYIYVILYGYIGTSWRGRPAFNLKSLYAHIFPPPHQFAGRYVQASAFSKTLLQRLAGNYGNILRV